VVQIPGVITRTKSGSELLLILSFLLLISKVSWQNKGHPAKSNKPNCYKTRCRLTFGNRSTLLQRGEKNVVIFGLPFCDFKR